MKKQKLAGKKIATKQDIAKWAKELFDIEISKSYRADAKDVGPNRYRLNIWRETSNEHSLVDSYSISHSCYIRVDENKNIVRS